ncbi:hypothetical protein NHJ13734_001673 [Beauveria thailandica]
MRFMSYLNNAMLTCIDLLGSENISADRAYRAGEEVYTSYGTAFQRLSTRRHMAALSERDLLGDFLLRADLPPRERTWVAMRGLASGGGVPEWDDWMYGKEDADGTLAEARAMLPEFLAEFRGDVEDHRRRIRELRDDANAAKMDMLLQRWNQLDELAWANGRAKQQSRGKDTKNKIR